MGKFKLVIIVILSIMIFSCGKAKPKLRIGLNADYPPFEFMQDQVLTGLDVEMANKLAESIGYDLEFIRMEFDELLPALLNNRIDLAISAITINPQRQQIVDFSIPYFSADQSLITVEDSPIKIDELTDIAAYKIGFQNGTTGQYFLQFNLVEKDILPWENLTAFDNNNQAISALMNDQIDLLILDDSAAKAFSNIKPLKIVHLIKTDDQYGIAMRKDYELKNDINTALRQIINSNYWTSLITKYLGN
ncbi:MAG: ABC transporter substrate-binding protein [Candidatus Stygibacter australis]|nr:ABC transporter substrate-binding protein [Candidatus Stygibacter australis]MDP8323098.1 ABC transporter substrate-binding protein [Candidatus Stygibacter australis]